MRNARRQRREPSERGTTLVELLVSMSIFSVCMTLVFGAVILAVGKANDVQKSADAVGELRLALAQIDRQVRSGNVLFSPANETSYVASCVGNVVTNSGTCMRIFTQANGSEKCVQWQIKDDPAKPGTKFLRTRSWAADWQTSANLTPWSTVARNLRLTAKDPFTLEGAATPYKERLLNVSLDAYDARRKTTVNVSSSLSGRNTSYGYNAAQCTPVPPE